MMDLRLDSLAPGSLLREFEPDSRRVDPRAEPAAALLAAIVDQLAMGIVAVDVDGRVVHANRAALEALRGSGLRIAGNGRLESNRARDNAALDNALAAVAKQRRSLITLGSELNPLTVAVQPLTLPGQTGHRQRAMLLFSRPMLCDRPALVAYTCTYQLTPAETAVVEALCGGLRAKEVAVQTGSSIATVRSHLRNIYYKTGARNLQDLLARIASLPPLAAPIG
jgi:DNA-binding CsgD family transcriptional regulator